MRNDNALSLIVQTILQFQSRVMEPLNTNIKQNNINNRKAIALNRDSSSYSSATQNLNELSDSIEELDNFELSQLLSLCKDISELYGLPVYGNFPDFIPDNSPVRYVAPRMSNWYAHDPNGTGYQMLNASDDSADAEIAALASRNLEEREPTLVQNYDFWINQYYALSNRNINLREEITRLEEIARWEGRNPNRWGPERSRILDKMALINANNDSLSYYIRNINSHYFNDCCDNPQFITIEDIQLINENLGDRERVREKIETLKRYMGDWTNPAFVIGFSAGATGRLMSVGHTSGIYFVPKSKNDPLFYLALVAVIALPVTGRVELLPGALSLLIWKSADYGFMTDLLSNGTGWGYSAGVGATVGVFRSVGDMRGVFNETGGSVTIGPYSAGIDLIFNSVNLPVGYMAIIGVSTPSIAEFHSRFGNTFVFSARELRLRRNW
jgi:hypothetical protein